MECWNGTVEWNRMLDFEQSAILGYLHAWLSVYQPVHSQLRVDISNQRAYHGITPLFMHETEMETTVACVVRVYIQLYTE